MPADFEQCVKEGGRVRSKRLDNKRYIKLCFKDGKSYEGEVHQYKKVLKKDAKRD